MKGWPERVQLFDWLTDLMSWNQSSITGGQTEKSQWDKKEPAHFSCFFSLLSELVQLIELITINQMSPYPGKEVNF